MILLSRKRSANLFLNLCLLTAELSQVVQLRSSDLTITNDLYLLNVRRIQRPCLLNADSAGFLANGEGLAAACSLNLQDSSLKDLNSGALSLLNSVMYANGITYIELRDFLLLAFLDFTDNAHVISPFLDVLACSFKAEDHLLTQLLIAVTQHA